MFIQAIEPSPETFSEPELAPKTFLLFRDLSFADLDCTSGAFPLASAQLVAFRFVGDFTDVGRLVDVQDFLGANPDACAAARAQGFVNQYDLIHPVTLSYSIVR
jgi:hypothetical protein